MYHLYLRYRILAAAVTLFIGLTAAASLWHEWRQQTESMSDLPLLSTDYDVKNVTSLHVFNQQKNWQIGFNQDKNTWQFVGDNSALAGYPIQSERLNILLQSLQQGKRLEKRTASADKLHYLELGDPENQHDGAGIKIMLNDDLGLIFGKLAYVSDQNIKQRRYMRDADSTQSWLAELPILPGLHSHEWLYKNFVWPDLSTLKDITIYPAKEKKQAPYLVRPVEDDNGMRTYSLFVLKGAPRKPLLENLARGSFYPQALEFFDFSMVKPLADLDFQDTRRAVFKFGEEEQALTLHLKLFEDDLWCYITANDLDMNQQQKALWKNWAFRLDKQRFEVFLEDLSAIQKYEEQFS